MIPHTRPRDRQPGRKLRGSDNAHTSVPAVNKQQRSPSLWPAIKSGNDGDDGGRARAHGRGWRRVLCSGWRAAARPARAVPGAHGRRLYAVAGAFVSQCEAHVDADRPNGRRGGLCGQPLALRRYLVFHGVAAPAGATREDLAVLVARYVLCCIAASRRSLRMRRGKR